MALLYFNAQMCGNKGVLADARFLVIQENSREYVFACMAKALGAKSRCVSKAIGDQVSGACLKNAFCQSVS